MSVGYIFPHWNAFNSPYAPVTIRFLLHLHTHTHIQRTHSWNLLLCTAKWTPEYCWTLFKCTLFGFGMFHSYIIRRASHTQPVRHRILLSIGAYILIYILFKFPKLLRRGPNTKLNLFISFCSPQRLRTRTHRIASCRLQFWLNPFLCVGLVA